jgi:hypothetical protein
MRSAAITNATTPIAIVAGVREAFRETAGDGGAAVGVGRAGASEPAGSMTAGLSIGRLCA